MLQAIQAMYADVPVCVKTTEGLSGCFQSVLGVKQGCPLSPLLFGILLDDFESYVQQKLGDRAALPQLAGRTVPPLLFADDMFLISLSPAGLQALLECLQDYCDAKKLTVNTDKTQVMILRPGGGNVSGRLAAGEAFTYAGRLWRWSAAPNTWASPSLSLVKSMALAAVLTSWLRLDSRPCLPCAVVPGNWVPALWSINCSCLTCLSPPHPQLWL